MRTRTTILLAALAGLTLPSCNNGNKQPETNTRKLNLAKKPKQPDLPDTHGCFASMGYVWSAARDTCIRLWESASELVSTGHSEFVIYAVVSDDKMNAEIFIPDDSSFTLQGNGNNTYTRDSFILTVKDDKYQLTINGKPAYHTAPPEPPAQEPQPKAKRRRR